MIHAFRFHDYNLILDVESGALHSVDEPAFAVVQALEKGWDVYALPYPERQIREIVEEVEALRAAGLPCAHEYRLAPRRRIDFFVGGVGVEIKKGRPDPAALRRQLDRYAVCQGVEALVVLTQRAVTLPATLCGKPVRSLALNQLWGVALP